MYNFIIFLRSKCLRNFYVIESFYFELYTNYKDIIVLYEIFIIPNQYNILEQFNRSLLANKTYNNTLILYTITLDN